MSAKPLPCPVCGRGPFYNIGEGGWIMYSCAHGARGETIEEAAKAWNRAIRAMRRREKEK